MNRHSNPSIKIITPTVHALFDYLLVVLLFILPSVVSGVSTVFGLVLYTLGGLQLFNSLTTDFEGGLFAFITLRIHALIEILAAVALVISPWVIGFSGIARTTVVAVGVFVFVIWMLTDFSGNSDSSSEETSPEDQLENTSSSNATENTDTGSPNEKSI
jgi:hypothetical protein